MKFKLKVDYNSETEIPGPRISDAGLGCGGFDKGDDKGFDEGIDRDPSFFGVLRMVCFWLPQPLFQLVQQSAQVIGGTP